MTCNHTIIILTVVALFNLSTYSFISRCPIRLAKRSYLGTCNFALNAKKKASKFISDDLLSTLESEIEEKEKIKMPIITVDTNNNKDEDLKSISFKDKKFGKLGLSSDLLSSIVDDEVTTASEDSNENKKKKDKKKKKKGSSNSEASVEDEEDTVVVHEVVEPEESNNNAVENNIVPSVDSDEAEITGY